MAHSSFFELPPHDARQRTAGRLINIRHLKRGRIHLVARSHAADDRRIALLCLHHQLDFTGHGIDCVHNIVILGKIELIRRIRHVKHFVGMDHGIRVDLQNPLFCHVYFIFSDGFASCNDLSVQIRQTNFIVIDQVKGSNAASGKRFYRIPADAANAKHSNSCIFQTFHSVFPQQ